MSREKTKRNLKIVKLHKKGLTYRQLARIFDIDVKSVFRIVNREKYEKMLAVEK